MCKTQTHTFSELTYPETTSLLTEKRMNYFITNIKLCNRQYLHVPWLLTKNCETSNHKGIFVSVIMNRKNSPLLGLCYMTMYIIVIFPASKPGAYFKADMLNYFSTNRCSGVTSTYIALG